MYDSFIFQDRIPASKSLLNRALIVQSFFPYLELRGDSCCEDVVLMKEALQSMPNNTFHCGGAGTVFRFLTLRLSREQGVFHVLGRSNLLQRPQEELIKILDQLGVKSFKNEHGLHVESKGWLLSDKPILIDRSSSSQFASAVLLSSWQLQKNLQIKWINSSTGSNSNCSFVSDGYLQMTLSLLRKLGMQIQEDSYGLIVEKNQIIKENTMAIEIDLSSAFAVCALGLIGGRAKITNFPLQSLQPDRAFTSILEAMGADLYYDSDANLIVKKTENLKAIKQDLSSCPDIFPVLAVLASFAKGTSILYGAPHLQYKESPRITKIAELLNNMQIPIEVKPDGLLITGNNKRQKCQSFVYNPENDHRLVMAATVAQFAGMAIRILNTDVVQKSYPDFQKWIITSMWP